MADQASYAVPTWIYHITSIRNLEAIVAQGGIWCKRQMERQGLNYCNIAHQGIQDRRERYLVRCGPGGTLHDYVPFYFAPRSPMLYAISRGQVSGYQYGQREILHLAVRAQEIQEEGQGFVFTNGHATIRLSRQFDDLARLDQIDWNLMSDEMWRDTEDDPDRKRRRQAEFLIHNFVPWKFIRAIGVIDRVIQQDVLEMLRDLDHQPHVVIRRHWYY